MPEILDRSANILFREYGRNVQNMVEHIKTLEDAEQRNRLARTVVELMRQLNPEPANDTQDYYHKLWDQLHIMSGFALDVESPFEKPTPEKVAERPAPLAPAGRGVKNKSYGKNLQLLIQKAVAIEDLEEQEVAVITIGRLIKGFYAAYNREIVDDKSALEIIRDLSNGKLNMDLARVEHEGLFNPPRDAKPIVYDMAPKNSPRSRPRQGQSQNAPPQSQQAFGGGRNKPAKRRRY